MKDFAFKVIIAFFLVDSESLLAKPASRKNLIEKKSQPLIKVLIGKDLKSVFISGFDLRRKFHTNSGVRKFKGRKSIKFNCLGFTKKNHHRMNRPVLLASLKSSTGLLTVKEKKYQGELLIVASHNESSCDLINEVPMETYLSSLLAKEMNSKWHIEALKAQAVAARSYALHKMNSQQVSKGFGYEVFYDLENSEKHQVGGSFLDATTKTEMATRATRGKILVDGQGKLQPIFFHASCGGKTLKPDEVWENEVPDYQSVPCRYCLTNKKRKWGQYISKKRFSAFLSWAYRKGHIENDLKLGKERIKIVSDRFKKRTLGLYIGKKVFRIEKNHLRRYFGRVVLPSNFFKVMKTKKGLYMKGQGNGHGVGMCQVGAYDFARRGWGYQKILSHYFPNYKLKKIY